MGRAVDWESRIGRRLRLRDLHILFAVVDCGSMAKAAARLRVTQPAISKAIGDLEAAVGVRLLDRGPHGVEPTVYGHALLKCGLAVFDELRQGMKTIEHLADPAAGELRIGCQDTLASTILPSVIDQLSHHYPRVVFNVARLITPTLQFPELHERTLDLVLTRLAGSVGKAKVADDLNVEVLFEDQVFVVAGARSDWARRRKLDLSELAEEPWVVGPPGSWLHQFLTESFEARGLEMPRVKVSTYSVPLRDSLLSTGRFLGVIDGFMLRLRGKELGVKALPINLPVWPWPIAIIMLKNRTVSPVVKLFIEYVRAFTASGVVEGEANRMKFRT